MLLYMIDMTVRSPLYHHRWIRKYRRRGLAICTQIQPFQMPLLRLKSCGYHVLQAIMEALEDVSTKRDLVLYQVII
jgi:hypothetical protein